MKTRFLFTVTVSASLLFVGLPFSAVSAASAGQKCSKVGLRSGTKKAPLICAKVGKKLVWKSSKAPTTTTTTTVLVGTVSQRNAVKAAKSYLSIMAFSRTSLIKQLEFEKYSTADATYGVDAQNADWNAQAAKSAKSYLELMAFSRTSLIDQLLYEGFTQEQAEYGVGTTGL
jgi:hypothetical protein